ncbi:protein Mpv17-like [Aethina tumida]|uniref:protein Mpv17-like n=1 Tax=Aethina tumida TaxID=116153 RepID=UPI00096AF2DB|nr:protein Mpv17-like [Aethina tumida]
MSGRLVLIYKKFTGKHLIVHNAIQTGLLMGCGDLIAQTVVEKKPLSDVDVTRTAKFFSFGIIFVGPTISTWYKFLDKKFIAQAGQLVNKKHVLFKKVALDQFVFAPSFIAVFLGVLNAAEGRNLSETRKEITNKYPDILTANYKLWPWVQLVNFYFVPLRHQVLVVQSVALLWNTYISWKSHA